VAQGGGEGREGGGEGVAQWRAQGGEGSSKHGTELAVLLGGANSERVRE
jgi:hypothetical protein